MALFAAASFVCASCGSGNELTSGTLEEQASDTTTTDPNDSDASWRNNPLAQHILEPTTFGQAAAFVEVNEFKASQPGEALPELEECDVEPLGSFKGIEAIIRADESDILLQVRTASKEEIEGFFISSEKIQKCRLSDQTTQPETPVEVKGADRMFQTTISQEDSGNSVLSETVAAQFDDKLIILTRTSPSETANLQELANWVATTSKS